jgi:hypothetical protein
MDNVDLRMLLWAIEEQPVASEPSVASSVEQEDDREEIVSNRARIMLGHKANTCALYEEALELCKYL